MSNGSAIPQGFDEIENVSTREPYWKAKCEEFRNQSRAFRLIDVISTEHIQFVSDLSEAHDLEVTWERNAFLMRARR